VQRTDATARNGNIGFKNGKVVSKLEAVGHRERGQTGTHGPLLA
jgi:hypothetical protein